MGSERRMPGMAASRRGMALLALTLLVLSVLAKPAVPNLADRASPASDILLAEADRPADPATMPQASPSSLSSAVAAVLARTLGEPVPGVPPVKKPVPPIGAEGRSAAPAPRRIGGSDVDPGSAVQISAVGSVRAATGPPRPIA
jgi:hypothetical protein